MPSDDEWTAALALCESPREATLAPGLTDAELSAVEERFGFSFPPDLRHLLGLALPLGDRWPDWRSGTEEDLVRQLSWPTEGILFDVVESGFWHPSWPVRPATRAAAVLVAREEMSAVPPLVPVYGHRYLPTRPSLPGNPVLSVWQTDIIHYGSSLLEWFASEFRQEHNGRAPRRVPFWSSLVEANDRTDAVPFELGSAEADRLAERYRRAANDGWQALAAEVSAPAGKRAFVVVKPAGGGTTLESLRQPSAEGKGPRAHAFLVGHFEYDESTLGSEDHEIRYICHSEVCVSTLSEAESVVERWGFDPARLVPHHLTDAP